MGFSSQANQHEHLDGFNPQPGSGDNEDHKPDVEIHIDDLKIAHKFINSLHNALLDDEDLPKEVFTRLRHLLQHPFDIDDPDICLSIDLFLSTSNVAYAEPLSQFSLNVPSPWLASVCLPHIVNHFPMDMPGCVWPHGTHITLSLGSHSLSSHQD